MQPGALRVLALVASFFAAAQPALVLAASDGTVEGVTQLTDANFKSSVASGVWIVEHFSPKCPHCRSFAPTWEKLAGEKKHLEALTGTHMAQVNCLAQGDLCTANEIKFYPQIKVWQDSQLISTYEGDRSHDHLSTFMDDLSTNYSRSLIMTPASTEETRSGGTPNADGKVLELDPESFGRIKDSGEAAFIEFFAPWCGHCKKLAPTWAKVAEELQGKTTIASVNCEKYISLCKAEGIPGYPTLHLYHDGTRKPYNGGRKLDAMVKFGSSITESPRLSPVLKEDFKGLVEKDEIFFLILHTFSSKKADLAAVDAALKPLLGAIPSYISRDPALYTDLTTIPGPSTLMLVFKDHDARPVSSLPFTSSLTEADVKTWVERHRFATMTELTTSNHDEVMKSATGALVVLAALKAGPEGDEDREDFKEVATAWAKGGRHFKQPVWFLWIDGVKWKKFLKQSYGINSKKLPAVVVVDPPKHEYYDMTLEKTKLSFDGGSIFSTLEGVYQHFLPPKKIETTLEWGSRETATISLISIGVSFATLCARELTTKTWSIAHPILAFSSVITSIVVFVFMLQRCMSRDQVYRELHGEKNGARLD